jgi:hypothetical protein
MTGSMSDFLELKMLDHILRTTAYTPPATVYLALYTVDPADDDTGTEVTGGAYARQTIAFNAAATRATENTSLVTYPTATADWGTVSHWGLRSAITAGDLLFHGDFTASKLVSTDDVAKVNAGDIDVSFNANGVATDTSHSWLNLVLRNTAYTSPAAHFLALYTAAAGDADGGTEVTGGSYARQSIAFDAPSAGATQNSALVTFPTATADWGTVAAHGVRTLSTAGVLLFHGNVDTSKAVETDDTAKWPAGALNITAA